MYAPHFALLFKNSLSSETKSFSSALACQKLIHIAVQPEQKKLTTDHISILNFTLRFIVWKVQYQAIRHVIQKLGIAPSLPTFSSQSIWDLLAQCSVRLDFRQKKATVVPSQGRVHPNSSQIFQLYKKSQNKVQSKKPGCVSVVYTLAVQVSTRKEVQFKDNEEWGNVL